MSIITQHYDVVIVGGGGSGLRAAQQLSDAGKKVAVISKVFPTRSHTVSAQGGINAALAAADEDDWRWHTYDTIKGSDYLGDQDCIEYMCHEAPEAIIELEHMGMPFSRNDDGRIYQRRFGGQSKNFGGEQAARTCAVADRTGHALLHTLFQQNIKLKTRFYNEWFALNLVKGQQDNSVAGVVAMNIENGEKVFFHAKAVILATGGAGRIFASTTNAHSCTGDGLGLVLRAGFELQDMEMWQFHPTGIAGAGSLVTEGCRGEGGYLVNKDGERFMERYAPNAKDLASRDVVSRSIMQEIREGRGCGSNGDYIHLKLEHLGADLIKTRLPGIRELAMTFAHADPINVPIPVVPTCHYMMGGIPTNVHGQVIHMQGDAQSVVNGLYAVGECACVSVHGANRLGGNSLLDLVVFGRAAGLHLQEEIAHEHVDYKAFDMDAVDAALAQVNRWDNTPKGERVAVVRQEMQKVMQEDFGVFRTAQSMVEGKKKLLELKARLQAAALTDTSMVFNTARVEALELDNMMEVAIATAVSATERQESRGAHARIDYPDRDDKNWLKHILINQDQKLSYREVNFKPKMMDPFEPKERVY